MAGQHPATQRRMSWSKPPGHAQEPIVLLAHDQGQFLPDGALLCGDWLDQRLRVATWSSPRHISSVVPSPQTT